MEKLGYVSDKRNQQAARSRGADPTKLLPAAHHMAALVKRWLLGTHQGSPAASHLASYLNEFVFRFKTVGAHAAAEWCFTGCLNSPSHTILCAIETSSSHINLGDLHQNHREDRGTRQAWSVLQQAVRGEPRTRPTSVKWIPRRTYTIRQLCPRSWSKHPSSSTPSLCGSLPAPTSAPWPPPVPSAPSAGV